MIILKKLLHINALLTILTKCEVKMAGYKHILRTKTKLREKPIIEYEANILLG